MINIQTREVYNGIEMCNLFHNISNLEQLLSLLTYYDGCYSCIIENKEYILAAVDISRSLPLYYSSNGFIISDSAEEIRKELGIAKDDVDDDKITELYANYFLFGHDTVYPQIKQLDLGEAIEISVSGIKTQKYYHHIAPVVDASVSVLKERLTKAAYNTFERIKIVIGDRPVVLSMSGGYDSRFVGCMLKNVGITDVSCYTYGKLDSFEVKQSKKNADALGFRWACAEMTDEDVKKTLDEVGQKYLDSYCGHDFTAYVQNFPAVRKLHEQGYFKPGSVFLTGLCGDMPTGYYLRPYDESFDYSIHTAAERLYELIFTRYNLLENHKKRWLKAIEKELESLPIEITDYQSWVSAVDCIYTGTCHNHWYMHMNSVHSFFGYEWLLPYWDRELLNAWYSIPAEKRFKQGLYQNWLLDDICAPYGIGQKKIICSYSKNRIKAKMQYVVGGLINIMLLNLGIPFRRKQDFNNFAPLAVELFRKLKNKKINYRRAGMMQLLENYLFEKRYGVRVIKNVENKIVSNK